MSYLLLSNAAVPLCGIALSILLTHLLIYLVDPYKLQQYPGPFLAKFSPIWLGRISQQGYRSEVIHKMHKKYGLSHFQPFITL
jgi:benzoate 4-monooxygenase